MNPQNGQNSLDYLNQIAPQAPKRKAFELNIKSVLIIGAALVVLVLLLTLVVKLAGSGGKEPWQRLSYRINTTAQVSEDARLYIKDSRLQQINSNLKLALTGAQRDMPDRLAAVGIVTPEKPPKKAPPPTALELEEDGSSLKLALDNGRLNAVYDSTYAREMTYQLSTLLSLIEQMHKKSSSEAAKEYLQSNYNNILPSYQELEQYSTANE